MIASHAGYRFGGQQYNVTDADDRAGIAARGGVIGLIFAQHQINDGLQRTDTKTLDESLAMLAATSTRSAREHVALGSDLDGFIKPTLGGIETAADLKPLAARAARPLPRAGRADPRGQRPPGHRGSLCQRSTLTPRISIRISSARRARAQQHACRTRGSAGRCPCPPRRRIAWATGRSSPQPAQVAIAVVDIEREDLGQLARGRVAVEMVHRQPPVRRSARS